MVRHAKPPVELHLLDGTDHFMFVNADPRRGDNATAMAGQYFLPGGPDRAPTRCNISEY